MKKITFILIISLMSFNIFGQTFQKLIRQGYNFYIDTAFSNSENKFQKALSKDSTAFIPRFNLGDAIYKQAQYERAEQTFETLTATTEDKKELANVYYNLGNSQLKQAEAKYQSNDIQGAIDVINKSLDSYKNSMRNNPDDKETKYNYLIAKELLKQLNQQNQNQNQNQNQEQNQEQQEQNQDQKENEKQNESQNQDTDEDGIPDETEKKGNSPDTDKDGAKDYNDVDADNDGLPDSYEAGKDPQNPQDTDKDGTPDYKDLDSNNDGKPDSEEAKKMYKISKEDAERILDAIDKQDKETYEKVKEQQTTTKQNKDKDW